MENNNNNIINLNQITSQTELNSTCLNESQEKNLENKNKEENVTNQIALNKAYEKISENKNTEKNNNLNLEQNKQIHLE